MALRERLSHGERPQQTAVAEMEESATPSQINGNVNAYQDLKSRIHRKLLNKLDLVKLNDLEAEKVQQQIDPIVRDLLDIEEAPLNAQERARFVEEIKDEVLGLGPLEPLLKDPTISDILINGYKQVYIERHGKLEHTDVAFKNDDHLMQIIDRIVSRVGRRVDELMPMVDARLSDGSRVNAIIPPLALDGPSMSIRRFGTDPFTVDDLVRFETLTPDMLLLLQAAVRGRLNMLISGGTGSGKTTLLNGLSSFIPASERIVTIEDSAELQLQQEHVVRLETRPPNIEGRGQITQRDLVRNSLRMRPDRIVIGEVRGAEALDMLQAMNTGHEGSLTTLHANSPRDAFSRLETMISMSGLDLPNRAMRQQISSAINVVVQATRLSDGKRKIINISEVIGMENDIISMQEIFKFERTGIGERGEVLGEFKSTGIRPKFASRLKDMGIELPEDLFRAE